MGIGIPNSHNRIPLPIFVSVRFVWLIKQPIETPRSSRRKRGRIRRVGGQKTALAVSSPIIARRTSGIGGPP